MKIIIQRNQDERQSPVVTIDLDSCHYPYAIRQALKLALDLDGYTPGVITSVFNEETVTEKTGSKDEVAKGN